MKTYQYLNAENTVVAVIDDDGISRSSCLASALPKGTVIEPYVAPPPAPVLEVSPRQIRQALTRVNLREQVEAAVAAGDQDTKDWYEFATVFQRNNPVVLALGAALGVTTEQLDGLWTLAGSL